MSGSERVNTRLSGSARADIIKGHQQGEILISEEGALQVDLEQKRKSLSRRAQKFTSRKIGIF